MQQNKTLQKSQDGMVSFLIVMIMMMVITLIVVGFTQVVNQNRRDALDRQLSTQAFYAAESGVNDAIRSINEKLGDDPAVVLPTVTDCTGPNSASQASTYGLGQSELSAGSGVSYSCLLVDPVNSTLEYSDIKTNLPTVVAIRPVDAAGAPATIDSMELSWAAKSGDTAETSGCTITSYQWPKTSPDNCDFGVLRTEVYKPAPTDLSSGVSFSLYGVPKEGGTKPIIGFAAGSGRTDRASCSSGRCSLIINNLGTASLLYLRANMIYASAQKLVITGKDVIGNPVYFNGQVKIDATGKAQDVLRRIQVRYTPKVMAADSPVSAIMGANKICKRFAVGPNTYQDRATSCVSAEDDSEPSASPEGCTRGEAGCPGDDGGDGGGGTPDPTAYFWNRTFRNGSVNDPALVTGCTWDWGDGTPPGNTACLENESISHRFVHPYKGLKCYTATITLTIKFSTKDKTGTMTQKVPYGPGADEYCGGKWPAV